MCSTLFLFVVAREQATYDDVVMNTTEKRVYETPEVIEFALNLENCILDPASPPPGGNEGFQEGDI